MEEKKLNQAELIWQEYETGQDYKSGIGLNDRIKTNVDFYEGRQWAAPTKNTRALPRPVLNFIEMIVNNKVSAMNNSPVKVVYEAENEQATQEFTRFNEYICKEMDMDKIDHDAIVDSAVKGNMVKHYYWDTDAKGKRANVQGALRCELVDIRSIIFANPNQTDIQKQKYIIIATREELDAVKEYAELSGISKIEIDKIVPDEKDESFDTLIEDEADDKNKLVTILTKYYKKDGEVWCCKSTRTAMVKKDFALSLDIEAAKQQLGYVEADEADTNSPDNPKEDTKAYLNRARATLYPIAIDSYKTRDRSIYGISEVEGLIPNQRIINFGMAMMIYQLQQMAWSKWKVSPDALRGQEISNESGQVLVDYSKTGNGINRIEGVGANNNGINILDNIINYTRAITGSTEVMTGELVKSGMSGAAIAQLQAQAQQPIEELRKRFWRFKQREGEILEQFYRIYYIQDFSYPYKEIVENKEVAKDATFNAGKYANVDFEVVAKSTQGTRSSASGDITFLDALLKAQAIDVYDYVNAYPDEALTSKGDMVTMMEKKKQDALLLATQKLQERDAQLEQALGQLQQVTQALNAVQQTNNENQKLKEDIAILYNEFRKSQNANTLLKSENRDLFNDADLFAQELGKARNLGKQDAQQTQQPMSEDMLAQFEQLDEEM